MILDRPSVLYYELVLFLTTQCFVGKHVLLVGMGHHTTHPSGLQVAQSSKYCWLSPFRRWKAIATGHRLLSVVCRLHGRWENGTRDGQAGW